MPNYGNFENRPVSWKLVPIEQNLAQFRPERQFMYNSITFSVIIPKGYSRFRKLGRNSKMAHRRVKQIENLAAPGVCSMDVGIFYLEHVKLIWGHLVHFSENWAVSQKRGNHRAKPTEIWT